MLRMRFYGLSLFKILFLVRYVGRHFVKESDKPLDVLTKINELDGFLADEEIELFEVRFLLLLPPIFLTIKI